ncbi:MAG TPA: PilZ domain-containing protein [Candidatus Acidoferrum sp.]|nr:PilZ domain-containing protein [Candidatus Dormibacteraeota bacterium]HXN51890.1 PilZ domain-containing protein [Candidatus Acidoferrum sp.]
MDRREHHRAQLRLPVRVRWNTPFGQRTEVCKTLDISRGGLLVPCQEAHAPGVPLWVTFPYDTSLGDGQPEMLAKVVRVAPACNGNGSKSAAEDSNERAVALHFALLFRSETNGNGHAKERERRDSPRRPLALPVRVRPEHIPWFEEAMTIDVSAHGLRFVSSREYQEGERLLVSFEPTASAPWPTAETGARVVRIEKVPESAALAVTIVREA